MQYLGVTTLLGYVWFAFAGDGMAVVAVYAISSAGRDGATPIKLVLAGTAVTARPTSFATMVELSDPRTVEAYRSWALGSLAGPGAGVAREVWPFVVAGAVLAFASSEAWTDPRVRRYAGVPQRLQPAGHALRRSAARPWHDHHPRSPVSTTAWYPT